MKLSLNIAGVPTELINDVWPYVRDYIISALAYSDNKYTETDVYLSLLDKSMQLWVTGDEIPKGAGVTQIVNYPNKTVCVIMFYGGDGFDQDLLFHVEQWAKENNCTSIEVWGRKGWIKSLNDFHEVSRCISKDI